MSRDSLEQDVMACHWLCSKIRASDDYAQRFYATLCNNLFQKKLVWTILVGEEWSCSWRYAGGIVARIKGQGDYIDWYCSGGEGRIDGEVKEDLLQIGWQVIESFSC